MRARRGWAAVLLAGAAGVAGLGPVLWVTALPAGAATANVSIDDKQPPDPNGVGVFNQGVKSIHVNDRVLWTNNASNKHTVTSDPGSVTFDSGDLGRGGTFEFRFTTAGTYTYHCTRHPKMVGRVEVVDPNATTTTTAAPATTTTTAPPTTTTTAPASTTTAPPTTTTTAAPRPAAGPGPAPAPPVPNSAAAPPPVPPPSTTTSGPSTTTTTTVPPTTPTSAPPVLAGGAEGTAPPSSTAPPTTAGQTPGQTDQIPAAAGPPASPGGKLDVAAVALVSALVALGAFAVWTLIRIRPGRI